MRDNVQPLSALTALLAQEWTQPVPEAAHVVAAEIQHRHAEAIDAVLFYGSCLRTQQTADAVLDFYVLVRSYRSCYDRPLLRWLNALLPPNVFYMEVGQGTRTLRAKYAVISTADFEAATTPAVVPAIIWARFCQPTRLVFARSEEVQERVIHAATQAVLTFLSRVIPFFARIILPGLFTWPTSGNGGFEKRIGLSCGPNGRKPSGHYTRRLLSATTTLHGWGSNTWGSRDGAFAEKKTGSGRLLYRGVHAGQGGSVGQSGRPEQNACMPYASLKPR